MRSTSASVNSDTFRAIASMFEIPKPKSEGRENREEEGKRKEPMGGR